MTNLVPVFESNPIEYGPGNTPLDQAIWKTPLRDLWWATKQTADELAKRYGAETVGMPPYYPAKWARVGFEPALMWYLRFPDDTLINAGYLADYFRRNPEAEHPGLADKYVRQIIAAEQAAAK
jgi:hypothetical protein